MGLDTILAEIRQVQVANTIVLRRLHTKLKTYRFFAKS